MDLKYVNCNRLEYLIKITVFQKDMPRIKTVFKDFNAGSSACRYLMNPNLVYVVPLRS